ncbi:hypothetical protein TRIATDRAFT_271115 [Trichoderma atroviride IMI 206040]|uniref:Uncharacterized protein n=1 Tax=Hypocrea atroviridis (strain ATCC 20476 / IMI 206040) TaxID=452589 RepID=G9NJM5_HYPAI|nr:uncharacterized protein TRIATDRAFT_271115 [Trichoderma atroviride IMI 206040]EHK49098.1 hypothetical protein TRIATDRAFT_271115 [Trichoderma atroviride IMI 206040]
MALPINITYAVTRQVTKEECRGFSALAVTQAATLAWSSELGFPNFKSQAWHRVSLSAHIASTDRRLTKSGIQPVYGRDDVFVFGVRVQLLLAVVALSSSSCSSRWELMVVWWTCNTADRGVWKQLVRHDSISGAARMTVQLRGADRRQDRQQAEARP